MPVAELEKLIRGLDDENYSAVVKYVLFLEDQQSKAKGLPDASKRIGVGKGRIAVPGDLDACNDEIASLFGVL